MTPRQKKRQMRASAKGHPLSIIRFRAIANKFQAGITAAMVEIMDGHKTLAQVMHDHIRSQFAEVVLRPMVQRVVRDVAGVYA